MYVGKRLGRPRSRPSEKTLAFPRESPTMQPLGFGKQAARPVLLRVGVFSPGPPNRVWEDPLNPAKFPVLYRARAWWLATRLSFLTTHCLRRKFPNLFQHCSHCLGRELHAWV